MLSLLSDLLFSLRWFVFVPLIIAVLHLADDLYGRLNEKSLKNEVVVITGAGSGIGRLTALRLAAEGARVAVLDVNKAGADATAGEITKQGGQAKAYACDVSDREAVYALGKTIIQDFGQVDVLINNAGIVSGKKFLENPDDMILKTFHVNTISHFWTVKAFLPEMLRRDHGHIVTIASAAGTVGITGLSDYCASKFGAVGFDESLRMELRSSGKHVYTTCVNPYYIATGMFAGVRAKGMLPGLDFLDPEYVAGSIVTAIKRNKPVLYLPVHNNLVNLCRAILPTRLFDRLLDATKMNHSMSTFVGREKKE